MIRAMSWRRPSSSLAVLVLAVAGPLLCGAAATADLLVTRDGTVLETRGAWRVEGKLVIFELAEGQLASMQLREVDLDASRAAMEAARTVAAKPPEPAPPEKPAVMVLTDADVRSVSIADADSEGSAAAESEAAGSPAAAQRLVVSSWEDANGPDGLVITGELVNQSAAVAANIQLGVLLFDRQGELLSTVLATVTAEALQPGQRARFRADAEGIFDFSALRFEAESLGLEVGPQEESSGDEG